MKRIETRRALRTQVVAYLATNAFLVVIWAVTGGGSFWPVFIIGGWGTGLVLHARFLYQDEPISESMIQREIDRERRQAPRDREG